MEDQRATGIILRTRPLTETSLIVQWLTPDLGRLSTVAKGARRPKSPFIGKLDLYYEADFSFRRARRSTLHTLREVSIRSTRPNLRRNFLALDQAAESTRWLEKSTEEETPLPEIFTLFQSFLNQLALPPLTPTLPLSFQIRLLAQLGLDPDLANSPLTPGSRESAKQLQTLDWAALPRLKLSHSQVNELSNYLDTSLKQGMS